MSRRGAQERKPKDGDGNDLAQWKIRGCEHHHWSFPLRGWKALRSAEYALARRLQARIVRGGLLPRSFADPPLVWVAVKTYPRYERGEAGLDSGGQSWSSCMPSDVVSDQWVDQKDEPHDGFAVDGVVAPRDGTQRGGDVLLETGAHQPDALGVGLTLL